MYVCVYVECACVGEGPVPFYSQLHSVVARLRIMEVADSFKESHFQRSL